MHFCQRWSASRCKELSSSLWCRLSGYQSAHRYSEASALKILAALNPPEVHKCYNCYSRWNDWVQLLKGFHFSARWRLPHPLRSSFLSISLSVISSFLSVRFEAILEKKLETCWPVRNSELVKSRFPLLSLAVIMDLATDAASALWPVFYPKRNLLVK